MSFKAIKIVVSTSLGKLSSSESKESLEFLTLITGQKALPTKAKKSISNFNIRKGMINGAMVTLRGQRAVNFLQKVTLFVLTSNSTFKGLPKSCLSGKVLNFGIRNLHTFPEVSESGIVKGANLAVVCPEKEIMEDLISFCKVPII